MVSCEGQTDQENSAIYYDKDIKRERKRGSDRKKDVYVTDRNKRELPRSVTVMDTAEELSAPCLFLASQ